MARRIQRPLALERRKRREFPEEVLQSHIGISLLEFPKSAVADPEQCHAGIELGIAIIEEDWRVWAAIRLPLLKVICTVPEGLVDSRRIDQRGIHTGLLVRAMPG